MSRILAEQTEINSWTRDKNLRSILDTANSMNAETDAIILATIFSNNFTKLIQNTAYPKNFLDHISIIVNINVNKLLNALASLAQNHLSSQLISNTLFQLASLKLLRLIIEPKLIFSLIERLLTLSPTSNDLNSAFCILRYPSKRYSHETDLAIKDLRNKINAARQQIPSVTPAFFAQAHVEQAQPVQSTYEIKHDERDYWDRGNYNVVPHKKRAFPTF